MYFYNNGAKFINYIKICKNKSLKSNRVLEINSFVFIKCSSINNSKFPDIVLFTFSFKRKWNHVCTFYHYSIKVIVLTLLQKILRK